jgi:predicted dehydrogenase
VTVRVGLVGAGLMGSRRAASIAASRRSRLVTVADLVEEKAADLARRYEAAHTTEWRAVVDDPGVDAVVVATVNRELAPITIAALTNGKHVLCEKPPGRNGAEAASMAEAARQSDRTLKIGFTLRFHPALRRAKRACEGDEIGPIFFLRAVYGHGGRRGYAQEWRGSSELAGGGELLDQGVHLLDLTRWFLGDGKPVAALTARWYWDISPLEDNAFILVQTSTGQVASLHTSWTQWRNRFSFEVYGRDGYLSVDGLGGSYGTETLTIGRRQKDAASPAEERVAFDGPDPSWQGDWDDFLDAVELGRRPAVDGEDGAAVMRMVDAVYEAAGAAAVVNR